MTEWAGLEIRKAACPLRGFESLSLRKQGCKSASYAIYALFYTQKQVILKELQNFLGINTTIFANLILYKSI